MLTGVIVTLAVLLVVTLILGWVCQAWLGTQGFIAKQVRVELEQRAAERQIQHVAYAAMQKLLDEARRSSDQPR